MSTTLDQCKACADRNRIVQFNKPRLTLVNKDIILQFQTIPNED